jgi:hypothetical protein
LLRRVESKFAMPATAVASLLPALAGDYVVLLAGTALVASYRSVYFDTPGLAFYHAQRCGRRVRQKVRVRHYPDRRVSYLEVKMRSRDDVTTKARRPRAYDDDALSADDLAFVRQHVCVQAELLPSLRTDYSRITLLSRHTEERLTIDLNLQATRGRRRARLDDLAIVEVKQARYDRRTPAMAALRAAGWRTGWASKYCLGLARTSPDVRTGRLREGLRALEAVGRG